MAVFRIERTRDYTVMSNHHLKDTALSLKAKGLLSMMLSLPDEWNYTTRGLAAICKEGVDAIGGALRELEKAGYIVRRQLRGPGGRISDTEYTIYEKPCPGAEEPPEEPGPDTTPPDTAFPYLVEPDMVEPSTEKPAELNTKRSNTQKSNTHLSNTHSFVLSAPAAEGMKDVYEKREEIREQIEYDLICTPVNRTQVDEFVELMLEVAMTHKALYRDNADTIIGNMDARLFLGGSEPTTLKELSAALGRETIYTYNTGESRGRETSHSLNYQKLGKELASVDELAVLDGGKCILQLRGVRPFLSDKYDITKHPNYKYLSDSDKRNAFDIERFLSVRLKPKAEEVYDVYEVDLTDEEAATA